VSLKVWNTCIKKKVIHRDLKPGNLLVNSQGKIKLADFGASAELEVTNAITAGNTQKLHEYAGTLAYVAPEVVAGEESTYGRKVDIWSLGMTAIHIADRDYAFSGVKVFFIVDQLGDPSINFSVRKTKERWSPQFLNFLELCLTRSYPDRPSANQMAKHPWIRMFDFEAGSELFRLSILQKYMTWRKEKKEKQSQITGITK